MLHCRVAVDAALEVAVDAAQVVAVDAALQGGSRCCTGIAIGCS